MRRPTEKRIFAAGDEADFIGRTKELARLLAHARGESGSNGLVILAAPSAGTSELLRQTYDRLFFGQEEVIPFYFEIKVSDNSSHDAALRFLREFLLQTIAFRRRDAHLIDISPDICEIAELAVPDDCHWIDRMIETCQSNSKLNDERSFVRNCLSAPLRAAAGGARTFVVIDDLHETRRLDGGEEFLNDMIGVFGRANIPFVLAGRRRFLFAKTPFETMAVEPLSFEDAGKFAERLSAKTGVVINNQTRDLIAVQLGGIVGHVTSLFATAAANGNDLNSFEQVEQVYTNDLFGGRLGKYFDGIFAGALPDATARTRVLRLLTENIASSNHQLPAAYWKKHAGLADAEFDSALEALNCLEIVRVDSGSIETDTANIVLHDYIRGRFRLEIDGKPRALAVGEAISDNIKRAPQLMSRFYRRTSAIDLPELMISFNGRQISPALLDYAKFKDEFKGADDDKILKALTEDNTKLSLPEIVYTAQTASFYPSLNELCDAERSAVALGFSDSAKKEEVAWIAAEIDSKLEATRELAEFWCDRLEMAAYDCNFAQFKIWLVATEGFAPDAMDVLRKRNAYGSSRKQVELLSGILNVDVRPEAKNVANEYEIVVPMGEDTEMIAAHTIEKIARKHHFPAKAINQIKTALVEACINASEHSLSPDQKIYQKFTVDADKITITVSNRGVRLTDKTINETAQDEGRRGWGLQLMKGLMDDVTVEQTDDGTRITMVKYLRPA